MNQESKSLLENSKKYFICPNCGKPSVYNESFCCNCYESIDDLDLSEDDFVKPISEKRFYDPSNKINYKNVVYLAKNSGLVTYGTERNGEFIADFYSDPFIKNGNSISIQNDDLPEVFEISDWYLDDITSGFVYKGFIPDGNFFETYCETGSLACLEYWFTNTGDIYVFDPSKVNEVAKDALHPIKQGHYVRDGYFIQKEIRDLQTGIVEKTVSFVVNNRYSSGLFVSEDKFEYFNKAINTPIMVSNPVVAPAEITKEEFFEHYPCPCCNGRQAWENKSWKYYASGNISIYAECKICGWVAQEIEDVHTMKKIAYNGSKLNFKKCSPSWDIKYLDDACPYCHAYQVRHIKWKDKGASILFWGIFSSKIGTKYICDNCKRTWE